MRRRDLLKLGAAAPGIAAAQTAHEHAAHPAPPPDTAAWKSQFFDDHQNDTVIALIDRIIPATDTPGAKAAQVNQFLDRLLLDSPQERRQEVLDGLAWLDGYAIRKHRHPFLRCTESDQVGMLTALETSSAADLAPGRRFFHLMKDLTVRTYYATEIGFNELNKGGRVPAGFGCHHPEHA